MKDKELRNLLGLHSSECFCECGHGEIPRLWKSIQELKGYTKFLEARIAQLETTKKKK